MAAKNYLVYNIQHTISFRTYCILYFYVVLQPSLMISSLCLYFLYYIILNTFQVNCRILNIPYSRYNLPVRGCTAVFLSSMKYETDNNDSSASSSAHQASAPPYNCTSYKLLSATQLSCTMHCYLHGRRPGLSMPACRDSRCSMLYNNHSHPQQWD